MKCEGGSRVVGDMSLADGGENWARWLWRGGGRGRGWSGLGGGWRPFTYDSGVRVTKGFWVGLEPFQVALQRVESPSFHVYVICITAQLNASEIGSQSRGVTNPNIIKTGSHCELARSENKVQRFSVWLLMPCPLRTPYVPVISSL